jgi:hypothetical protein
MSGKVQAFDDDDAYDYDDGCCEDTDDEAYEDLAPTSRHEHQLDIGAAAATAAAPSRAAPAPKPSRIIGTSQRPPPRGATLSDVQMHAFQTAAAATQAKAATIKASAAADSEAEQLKNAESALAARRSADHLARYRRLLGDVNTARDCIAHQQAYQFQALQHLQLSERNMDLVGHRERVNSAREAERVKWLDPMRSVAIHPSSYHADLLRLQDVADAAADVSDVVELRLSSNDVDTETDTVITTHVAVCVLQARAARLFDMALNAFDMTTTVATVIVLDDAVSYASLLAFVGALHGQLPAGELWSLHRGAVAQLCAKYAPEVDVEELGSDGPLARHFAAAARMPVDMSPAQLAVRGIVTFRVGSDARTFRVHRRLLCARCDYFAMMFDSGLAEAQSAMVDLPDVDAGAFEVLLLYVYRDAAGNAINSDNAIALLLMCAEYSCQRLRNLAEAFVAGNVTAGNVGEVLQVAYYLDSECLKTACMYFASSNFDAVRRTAGYKQLQPELRHQFNIHVFDNT